MGLRLGFASPQTALHSLHDANFDAECCALLLLYRLIGEICGGFKWDSPGR